MCILKHLNFFSNMGVFSSYDQMLCRKKEIVIPDLKSVK